VEAEAVRHVEPPHPGAVTVVSASDHQKKSNQNDRYRFPSYPFLPSFNFFLLANISYNFFISLFDTL
jgi:hypothetical protein